MGANPILRFAIVHGSEFLLANENARNKMCCIRNGFVSHTKTLTNDEHEIHFYLFSKSVI